MTMPLLYQLQGADYASLAAGDFRVAVMDPDDSGLSAAEVSALQTAQGKYLFAYTSIGEAESYRDYWQSDWSSNPPDFLLSENPDWEGNYRVKFWDSTWQATIFARIDAAVAAGYNGVYLDIVDGYGVEEVIAAYPGTAAQLRQEMIDFVIAISQYAKAQNPDFAIIPQNAVGLLALDEDDPSLGANAPYIAAIDGLGVEDLWYDDNRVSGWTAGDLEFIAMAQAAGLFVLATSYPSNDSYQQNFITNALEAGLLPFAAERDLVGVIDAVNLTIEEAMAAMTGTVFNLPWQQALSLVGTGAADHLTGMDGNDTLAGRDGNDSLHGAQGDDRLLGGRGNDMLSGQDGADHLDGLRGRDRLFGGNGDDSLYGGLHEDLLRGGGGDDLAYGGMGADTLFGGAGQDMLRGGDHDDDLFGGGGRDALFGGRGADHLEGGAGNDTLTGGGGADVFVFHAGTGHDVITDFDPSMDFLQNAAFDSVSASQGVDALILTFSSGMVAELTGLTLADYDANPLIFGHSVLG